MSIFVNSLAFLGESLVYNHEELSAYLSLPPKTIIFKLTDPNFYVAGALSGGFPGAIIERLDSVNGIFKVYAPQTDWSMFFHGMESALEQIIAFNVSGITNISELCDACHELTSVTNIYNTNLITSTVNMFRWCDYLKHVDYFDTSNVTDMEAMFQGAASLENIPLFNTSKVTSMKYMFANQHEASGAFKPPYPVTKLIIPNFDTSSVTNMFGMFWGTTRPFDLPTHLNYSKVENVSYMFADTYNANPDTIYPMYNILRILPLLIEYREAFRACGDDTDASIWHSLPASWGGLA
ncbi:MAG: BspA family leucine-rich repeat surface protein [Methanobrevibacter sp.]|nr:BspA family leucine-rich repeat surface protein [Methanobrevibacter sp.]